MLGGIYHDQKKQKNRFVLRLLLLAVFGRTWGITVINDTLLPPLANIWKVRHLNLLFP